MTTFNLWNRTFHTGIIACLLTACENGQQPTFPAAEVVPTEIQYQYQQQELIGFIHFTVNTFTDREWGDGSENPAIFNPTELDAEQWAKTARDAGLKQLILTAKHHDGFCLWPSEYTEHSVKNSPWRDGKGDLVKEFTEACRKYGLKAGLYLSPWDRNHASYGQPDYIEYYRNQLKELLTNYGKISEIWFDGANGGDGYYGGANEERRIDKESYYEWDSTWALVKKLQPEILIFSDAGPDVHWIGNEKGIAGETFWSMMNVDGIVPGEANTSYLNTGDPAGNRWIVGQCDVSIRPGWFYHASEDSLVKSPQQLLDIYYQSVGRNCILLLNLPPDRRGLIPEKDVASLLEFKSILDETFLENLATGAKAGSGSVFRESKNFAPEFLTDGDPSTFWAADEKDTTAEVHLILNQPLEFDRIMLQEPVLYGQRISAFRVESKVNNEWKEVARGTTVGLKRLLRIKPVTANEIKIVVEDALITPALSEIGLFKSSEKESKDSIVL